MNFWLRNIIFGIILISLAYFLLANQEMLFSLAESSMEQTSEESTQENASAKTEEKLIVEAPQLSKRKISKNAAAEGLSRFYANLHGTDEDDGPRIREGVVYLPDPKGDLNKILAARGMVTRPLRKTFRGIKANRPFRKGETLFQKLSEYAAVEGLEVMWWLNRDLLIKDAFRINKDIIKTAYQIGNAVTGHFPNGVSVYFCHNQRAIVLIEEPIEFLVNDCALLPIDSRETRY